VSRFHPCLWFDGRAEEAARFYVSVFPRSKVATITRYGEAASKAAGRPLGSVLTVDFELDGQKVLALDGGPLFRFTEAVSLVVECEDQAEIDHYWSRLTVGGEESACGWLKDRFGLSGQVVPKALGRMWSDPDARKTERVMVALLTMKKLDLARLERAFEGR
jgi:predicted 3-demethylubiquinone-9 3-methyltransferase (glyoxalase superfamily)